MWAQQLHSKLHSSIEVFSLLLWSRHFCFSRAPNLTSEVVSGEKAIKKTSWNTQACGFPRFTVLNVITQITRCMRMFSFIWKDQGKEWGRRIFCSLHLMAHTGWILGRTEYCSTDNLPKWGRLLKSPVDYTVWRKTDFSHHYCEN